VRLGFFASRVDAAARFSTGTAIIASNNINFYERRSLLGYTHLL